MRLCWLHQINLKGFVVLHFLTAEEAVYAVRTMQEKIAKPVMMTLAGVVEPTCIGPPAASPVTPKYLQSTFKWQKSQMQAVLSITPLSLSKNVKSK